MPMNRPAAGFVVKADAWSRIGDCSVPKRESRANDRANNCVWVHPKDGMLVRSCVPGETIAVCPVDTSVVLPFSWRGLS